MKRYNSDHLFISIGKHRLLFKCFASYIGVLILFFVVKARCVRVLVPWIINVMEHVFESLFTDLDISLKSHVVSLQV